VSTHEPALPWWAKEFARRLDRLDDLDLAVVADRVETLTGRVDAMTSAFNRLLGGIVLATVTFALGIFALLGHR
jgi:hypothetical protein